MPKKKTTSKVNEKSVKQKSLQEEELITILEKKLPEILEKKPSIKKKLKELFSDVFVEKGEIKEILLELQRQREDSNRRFEAVWDEIKALREEMKKMREDFNRRFEEMRADMDRRFEEMRADMDRRFEEMREDTNRRFEAVWDEIKALREEMKNIRQDFHNIISSVGARWGEDTERMFREALKEILGKYYSATVKEIYIEDRDGRIKGYPAKYQVDVLVTDGETLLIEVKAQAIDLDVVKLRHLGKIYEEQHNVKPRLILLCAYAWEGAIEEANRFGDVEIITSPRSFRPR